MEKPCLFCLESIKENPAPNPIGCQCKIQAHEKCFHVWFEEKQQMECPICHTVSVPNHIVNETIHVVYMNTYRERQREEGERYRRNEKCMGLCCFVLLGWTIGLTILELVYR
jgi:hypothetical protein